MGQDAARKRSMESAFPLIFKETWDKEYIDPGIWWIREYPGLAVLNGVRVLNVTGASGTTCRVGSKVGLTINPTLFADPLNHNDFGIRRVIAEFDYTSWAFAGNGTLLYGLSNSYTAMVDGYAFWFNFVGNPEVRIYNGGVVVDQQAFVPVLSVKWRMEIFRDKILFFQGNTLLGNFSALLQDDYMYVYMEAFGGAPADSGTLLAGPITIKQEVVEEI